jgi:hypothetical protein
MQHASNSTAQQHPTITTAPHLLEDGQHHGLPGVVCQGEAAVPATPPGGADKEAVLGSKTHTRLQGSGTTHKTVAAVQQQEHVRGRIKAVEADSSA